MSKRTPPRCASCWGGEIHNEDVIGYFTGTRVEQSTGRKLPFRGWLCEAHDEIIAEDNALFGVPPLRLVKRPKGDTR